MQLSRDAASYIAPRRPGTPFDRLGALQEALRTTAGATHLAPVQRPRRILYVGAGRSHLMRAVQDDFPDSFAAAACTDPVPDGERSDAGLAVRADLARGLPFRDEAFDYVHYRTIPFGAREQDRARQVDELVRVLAPRGWIEIVETEPTLEPLSPSTERLLRHIWRLLEAGPDAGAAPESPADLLRIRGLLDVEARRYELPIGPWGGAVGNAMLSNFRAVVGTVAPAMEVRLGIPTLETLELVARSTEEIEQGRTVAPLWFVWGRRPAARTA